VFHNLKLSLHFSGIKAAGYSRVQYVFALLCVHRHCVPRCKSSNHFGPASSTEVGCRTSCAASHKRHRLHLGIAWAGTTLCHWHRLMVSMSWTWEGQTTMTLAQSSFEQP
jgi:hypothetical protein